MSGLNRRSALGKLGLGLAASALPFPARAAEAMAEEPALEPELEIVDPHFHLRDFSDPEASGERYLAQDFRDDIARSGHRITGSVFIECGIMYDTEGEDAVRSLGETRYVGELAQAHRKSGLASGIVAKVDLTRTEGLETLLARHEEAAKGHLRGVRNSIATASFPPLSGIRNDPKLLQAPSLRAGITLLGRKGLVFESWLFHPQMDELADLAKACPDTTIVLEHLGCPLGLGPYAGKLDTTFAEWRPAMARLAQCPNVVAKIGGLGPFMGQMAGPETTSVSLARDWKPWIETAIELFGPQRCMFESNWPANRPASTYGQIWNAFKLVTRGLSQDERAALFSSTARSIYRI
ncbi:amidohydrolase family protein [Novosphingobium sp. MBES04]|uniref:amidohydrolase family protein n=1 Tax=Novosphingobium sp. MBES04 TaxID=1206458 RepID=UPI0007237226|nr:amidohydrolase family protein [Novosphingobium sp. MBES04]GAM06695.1 amidohydrolase 2 [Novosphingobium sp. MBES04]